MSLRENTPGMGAPFTEIEQLNMHWAMRSVGTFCSMGKG